MGKGKAAARLIVEGDLNSKPGHGRAAGGSIGSSKGRGAYTHAILPSLSEREGEPMREDDTPAGSAMEGGACRVACRLLRVARCIS
jgi:hypothetical protein